MDTTEDKSSGANVAAASAVPAPEGAMATMDADLAQAMDENDVFVIRLPSPEGVVEAKGEEKKQGKKNARFGKNPDGTPAKKADKKDVERKSSWGIYLHQYKLDHPDLASLEATIEARKEYVPKSGKQKSFERIFTEVWKTKNPRWKQFSKEQRIAAIRADFIKLV